MHEQADIPHNTLILVGDGRKALFLRNLGAQPNIKLEVERRLLHPAPADARDGHRSPGPAPSSGPAMCAAPWSRPIGIRSRRTASSTRSPACWRVPPRTIRICGSRSCCRRRLSASARRHERGRAEACHRGNSERSDAPSRTGYRQAPARLTRIMEPGSLRPFGSKTWRHPPRAAAACRD